MKTTVVGPTDWPVLLPLMRAYCDFYRVNPSDQALLELSRSLLADPEREGLQLLTRDDAGNAVGFATLYWTWETLGAARAGVMNDLYVAGERADHRGRDPVRLASSRPIPDSTAPATNTSVAR